MRDFWARKWQKLESQKFLIEFFVGIDAQCFETYFKTKISEAKIFLVTKFLLDFVIFCQK